MRYVFFLILGLLVYGSYHEFVKRIPTKEQISQFVALKNENALTKEVHEYAEDLNILIEVTNEQLAENRRVLLEKAEALELILISNRLMAESDRLTVDDLKRLTFRFDDGTVYTNAFVKNVDFDGLSLTHTEGVSKVPLSLLPAALLNQR